MSTHPTAVIVGAGPGGATCALALARRGVRNVVLLDKDDFPRDKTCGSGLSPNCVTLLGELGLAAEVRRRGYPINAMRLVTPGHRELHLRTEEAAIVLLRRDFDHLLVDGARRLGVDFRPRHKVTEILYQGGRAVGVRGKDFTVHADWVLCADGAHAVFSDDPRPRRTISTLMGWWDDFAFEPNQIEMIFDRHLAPLYGWLFPEGEGRVNIGICIDGEDAQGRKTERNVRAVFARFLDDHFRDRLARARQVGKLKGHPISFTTWIDHLGKEGLLYLGEAARMTHNATGEGIYQAMQSGVYAAEAVADVAGGRLPEAAAWRRYTWACRRRFTPSFAVGHLVRGAVQTPLLDWIAALYNNPLLRRAATFAIASALTGSHVSDRMSPAPAKGPTTAAA